MKLLSLETIRLGLNNLRLHKLRSLLTSLGIIFGVAAVICMAVVCSLVISTNSKPVGTVSVTRMSRAGASVRFSSFLPRLSNSAVPPVRMATSSSIALRRSP